MAAFNGRVFGGGKKGAPPPLTETLQPQATAPAGTANFDDVNEDEVDVIRKQHEIEARREEQFSRRDEQDDWLARQEQQQQPRWRGESLTTYSVSPPRRSASGAAAQTPPYPQGPPLMGWPAPIDLPPLRSSSPLKVSRDGRLVQPGQDFRRPVVTAVTVFPNGVATPSSLSPLPAAAGYYTGGGPVLSGSQPPQLGNNMLGSSSAFAPSQLLQPSAMQQQMPPQSTSLDRAPVFALSSLHTRSPRQGDVLDVQALQEIVFQRDAEIERLRAEVSNTAALLHEQRAQNVALVERYQSTQRSLAQAVEYIQRQENEVTTLKNSLTGEVFDNDQLKHGFMTLIRKAQTELKKLREEMEYRERKERYGRTFPHRDFDDDQKLLPTSFDRSAAPTIGDYSTGASMGVPRKVTSTW